MSFKCPCYPKQSIDSMKFLSRYQWHISQNQKKIPKIYMEPQNSNLEKEEQSWRNHATLHQPIQGHSNQDSMVLE